MAKDRGKLRVWNIDKLDAKELALADCNNWSRKLPVHPCYAASSLTQLPVRSLNCQFTPVIRPVDPFCDPFTLSATRTATDII